jgi:hypothetical protein
MANARQVMIIFFSTQSPGLIIHLDTGTVVS